MTTIPDHALPVILQFSKVIEDYILTGMDNESREYRLLRHASGFFDWDEFPDGFAPDWEEPELEENSDEMRLLNSLHEIAIALLD